MNALFNPASLVRGAPPTSSGALLPSMRPEFQDGQFLADLRQLLEDLILIF